MKPYSIFNKYRKPKTDQKRKPHFCREPLNQDEIAKIIELRNAGTKLIEISKTMNINLSTVRTNIYKNKPKDTQFFRWEDYDEI